MKPIRTITLTTLAFVVAAPALADQISVVGSWSGLPLHKQYEAPFWTTTLPQASNGRLDFALTTHDQMGIKGSDVYRMLGDGVFDVGMTVADYAVGDAPALEGLDVPLIATSANDARKMVQAARPMVEDIYAAQFNSKVLAIAPYPPQIVFCNAEISELSDLKGKKIRASGRMTAKFLDALGAEGVNVSFSEVPGALQRGVVDCAVTGAGSGYSAGWWEVSTHLMTLPLGGWDPVVTAMNLDRWNSLGSEDQALIKTEIATHFEEEAWSTAEDALVNDVACLTGNGDCPAGESRDMVLVEPTAADVEKARKILVEKVLPDWAERAGQDWVERWNASVGSQLGVKIPL